MCKGLSYWVLGLHVSPYRPAKSRIATAFPLCRTCADWFLSTVTLVLGVSCQLWLLVLGVFWHFITWMGLPDHWIECVLLHQRLTCNWMHLAGQGIFFFSCIAALEAFRMAILCQGIIYRLRWEVFEVEECQSFWPVCVMSRQILSQYVFLYLYLSTHGTYIRQLCHHHASVQLCQAFWHFPRFYGGRISTTASTQPSSTLGQWCPMCRGIGLGLSLPSRVQWNAKINQVFLYFVSIHLIITVYKSPKTL